MLRLLRVVTHIDPSFQAYVYFRNYQEDRRLMKLAHCCWYVADLRSRTSLTRSLSTSLRRACIHRFLYGLLILCELFILTHRNTAHSATVFRDTWGSYPLSEPLYAAHSSIGIQEYLETQSTVYTSSQRYIFFPIIPSASSYPS